MEIPPLAPGITESIDKCTKKKRDTVSKVTVRNRQKILATIHKSRLYDLTPMA